MKAGILGEHLMPKANVPGVRKISRNVEPYDYTRWVPANELSNLPFTPLVECRIHHESETGVADSAAQPGVAKNTIRLTSHTLFQSDVIDPHTSPRTLEQDVAAHLAVSMSWAERKSLPRSRDYLLFEPSPGDWLTTFVEPLRDIPLVDHR